jgi:hypothetical protein
MRMMSVISLIASIAFGLIEILRPVSTMRDDMNGLYITMAFLVAAFAPKAVQKFAETKIPKRL